MSIPQPKGRFMPHKELQEGWTYISVPEDSVVIGVKVTITKVMKLLDADDKPLRDPTGNYAYSFQSSNVVKVLSKEEYNVIRGLGNE